MKTASINVFSLCVPCWNRCRYCLLSWDNKLSGLDYDRTKDYAARFHQWLKINRPELSFQFYFGHSMDHPRLLEEIKFLQSIGSAGGRFLQLNGLKFRSEEEVNTLLLNLTESGIELIDLTFYGTREYHDKFSARPGDFDYLISILANANKVGLHVQVGIPVTQENVFQIDPLLMILHRYDIHRIFVFVPHCEGRGASLENIRLTKETYDRMSNNVKLLFNRQKFRPESEWLEEGQIPDANQRMLGLSLTNENITFFEKLGFSEVITYLESLDNAYYAVVPSFRELSKLYGNPMGNKMYSIRDLYLQYQKRYLQDNHIEIHDINDERQSFSRRY